MSDAQFDIVFRGDIVIGQSLGEVKIRLGQIFKLGSEQIDKMFVGNSVVIKRGLTQDQAQKYRDAFAKAGAIVSLVAVKAGTADENSKRDRSFTLAPVGSNMTPRLREQARAQPLPDTGHLSLRPAGTELLDFSERKAEIASSVIAGDWGLAEIGALLETLDNGVLPLPILETDWDLAEVGADLGVPGPEVEVQVRAPDLAVAPAGSDLGELRREVSVATPDTSHLSLREN